MTPQDPRLPLFYRSLAPISREEHHSHRLAERVLHPFAAHSNAVPLTVDEFAIAQRHYPIVFAPLEQGGAPLALLGLEETENLFCTESGDWRADVYIPAYVRRYPFLLARITPSAEQLSLCFDVESGFITPSDQGNLFEGDQPSAVTKNVLNFCEQFELAVQRTRAFMDDISGLNILTEAEATLKEGEQSVVFRGFRMVEEKRVQDLRGDQARKLLRSGALSLIYAHLFSLHTLSALYALKRSKTAAS